MQGIETLIRSDDRGMAFAMWRCVPGSSKTPHLFFRFDFVVEVDLVHAYEAGAELITSREALRRRADEAFPVRHRSVWLTSDLNEVKNPAILRLLRLSYSKHLRPEGGWDVNLKPELWDGAASAVSLGDWPSLCTNARDKAEGALRSDPAFQKQLITSAERVRNTAAAVSVALLSRIERLAGPSRESEERIAVLEASLSRSLVEGIEEPSIKSIQLEQLSSPRRRWWRMIAPLREFQTVALSAVSEAREVVLGDPLLRRVRRHSKPGQST